MQIDGKHGGGGDGRRLGSGTGERRGAGRRRAKVAVFDVNAEKGEEVARAIGGVFCNVDITSEESVVAGSRRRAPRMGRSGSRSTAR
jgi:hypothetical protein